MIRWASTGPMPGRASSSVSVAMLTLTFVPATPDVDPATVVPGTAPGTVTTPPGPPLGTRTCSASVSSAARFSASSRSLNDSPTAHLHAAQGAADQEGETDANASSADGTCL